MIIVEQKEITSFQLDTVTDVIEVDEISEVAKCIITHSTTYKPTNTLGFDAVGDLIYLIGASKNDVTASLYVRSYRGIQTDDVVTVLLEHTDLEQLMVQLTDGELITSANRVAEGGLFMALVIASIPNMLGFSIKTDPSFRKDAFLFGESPKRVVVAVKSEMQADFEEAVSAQQIPAKFLGVVSKGKMAIDSEKIMDVAEAKALLGA